METLCRGGNLITMIFKTASDVYKNIKCKMAHVSFLQIGVYCVTAILTLLPYNSLKSYRENKSVIYFFNHHALLNALNALK